MTTEQPNILFIQCDQLTARFLGAYGNPIAKTPFIDQLGKQGTVFESAYTNFPLCAPSRFSMLSGMLASRIGAYDNGAEFPSSIPTMAHYMRSLGYQTSLIGKMHFVGSDQLHGFEERLTTDIYPADFNWTGDWTEVTPKFANDPRTFSQAGVCTRNVQLDYDEEVSHRACRKLYDLARREDPRPFFSLVSFTHPHDPYQCTQEYWDKYDHSEIDMPKTGRIADDELDPYSIRLRKLSGLDRYAATDSEIRRARHAYYGSVSFLDDQIGKLLGVLKTTGLDSNTVIVFTTDHGDNMGERGLWYKKNFYEDSCRIPLIVGVPGISPNRQLTPVSLVDLLPTLIEVTKHDSEKILVEPSDGENLLPLMTGREEQRTVFSEILAEGASSPLIMIRKGSLKYIYSGCDPELLYDLQDDPCELNNIAQTPESSSIVETFRAEIHKRWDIDNLTKDIIRSQKRRLFLRETLAIGTRIEWDYEPRDQAADRCLRAGGVYNNWAYDDVLDLDNTIGLDE